MRNANARAQDNRYAGELAHTGNVWCVSLGRDGRAAIFQKRQPGQDLTRLNIGLKSDMRPRILALENLLPGLLTISLDGQGYRLGDAGGSSLRVPAALARQRGTSTKRVLSLVRPR